MFEATESYWGYLGYTYAVAGRHRDARKLLATHPEGPGQRMLIHAGLGEREEAYQALLQLAERNPWRALTWMRRPEMSILHGDPRLVAIRARLGLDK